VTKQGRRVRFRDPIRARPARRRLRGTRGQNNPFRYFNSSPEVIRLVVMMYVRCPLSRKVEDLPAERRIDISHETVRFWWKRRARREALFEFGSVKETTLRLCHVIDGRRRRGDVVASRCHADGFAPCSEGRSPEFAIRVGGNHGRGPRRIISLKYSAEAFAPVPQPSFSCAQLIEWPPSGGFFMITKPSASKCSTRWPSPGRGGGLRSVPRALSAFFGGDGTTANLS
jgi:hypothetical protein